MGSKGLPTSCSTDHLFDSLPLALVWTSSPGWPLAIPQVPAEEHTHSVEPSLCSLPALSPYLHLRYSDAILVMCSQCRLWLPWTVTPERTEVLSISFMVTSPAPRTEPGTL